MSALAAMLTDFLLQGEMASHKIFEKNITRKLRKHVFREIEVF
jgi:hypothetical protein